MKIAESSKSMQHMRAQLTFLVLAAAMLFILSLLPSPRGGFDSSEVRFSEMSKHGLSIVPASCASGANYYHTALSTSGDNLGYVLPSGASEYGNYSTYAGAYVCASNSSGNAYFIPAYSANELSNFKAHPPSGVTAY